MAELTQFDLGSAARIARVVQAVEREPQRAKPLSFSPVMDAPREKVLFRVATYDGAWSTGNSKIVTFKYQTTTPNTVSVNNLTMHLPDIGLPPPYNCVIAKEGTAGWYLVSAIEHNIKRGTFSAPWNKNSSKTVALVNGGSVTALNRHANVAGSGTKNCTVGRDGMEWELIAAEC